MHLTRSLRDRAKKRLLDFEAGRVAYSRVQEIWFDRTYRRRRDRYQAQLADHPEAWNERAHIDRARRRLTERGYVVRPKREGEIHTFAYIPSNWSHQDQITRGLAGLGPVTRFDYRAEGFSLASLRTCEAGHVARRRDLQKRLLDEIRRTHRDRPIDWFFSYALAWDLSRETVQVIKDEIGVPMVNISLDDKNWWEMVERGDQASAMRNIAPHFDLAWTSARVCVPWYWAEGGQAVFLPEGVNVDWFRPLNIAQDIPVGFVGNHFGNRAELLRQLGRAGVPVVVHGNGWPGGALDDDGMLRFFNRCRLNLGLGDMHYSRWLTNLKGRDFEVPATGRGLYLTTYNSDLAAQFDVGREIQCYRGIDEMIELARHHLRNPEESADMAARARRRCIRDHQWIARYRSLLRMVGVLPDSDVHALSGDPGTPNVGKKGPNSLAPVLKTEDIPDAGPSGADSG